MAGRTRHGAVGLGAIRGHADVDGGSPGKWIGDAEIEGSRKGEWREGLRPVTGRRDD